MRRQTDSYRGNLRGAAPQRDSPGRTFRECTTKVKCFSNIGSQLLGRRERAEFATLRAMLHNDRMLRIHSTPELRTPALLCGFGGWADAASAASGAMRYLLLKREGRPIASFDPDSIYCYTTTRPLTLKDPIHQRRLEWPALDITAIEVPEAERDLLVMVGPEPDLRWHECVDAIFGLTSRLQVSAVLTFGAFLAQVHFAGTPAMTGISADPRMRAVMRRQGIEDTNYQGPTGFTTVMLREAIDRGIPAASLWVAAPSYLSSTSNPKLSAALLGMAERLLGMDLWKGELEAAGRHMERRLQDLLRTRPDLVDLLKRLEGESESEGTDDEPPPLADWAPDTETPEDLPTPEEVLRDLEEHLRRIKGDSEPSNGEEPLDRDPLKASTARSIRN